jgi:hypothetical protein
MCTTYAARKYEQGTWPCCFSTGIDLKFALDRLVVSTTVDTVSFFSTALVVVLAVDLPMAAARSRISVSSILERYAI